MLSRACRMPPVVMVFIVADLLLCLAFIANYLLGQPFSKPTALLDLNGENSLPAWYSSMQFFFIFLLAAIFVHNRFRLHGRRLSLIGLPALFLLMSIDESVMIHEYLGRYSDVLLAEGTRAGTMFQETGIWTLVVGLPFLLIFLLWVRSVRKQISMPSAVSKLVTGMGIMLAGALGCELLSNFIGKSLQVVELVLEEGLEMMGATVMMWAVYDLAVQYLPTFEAAPVAPAAGGPLPATAAVALEPAGCVAFPVALEVASLAAGDTDKALEEASASPPR